MNTLTTNFPNSPSAHAAPMAKRSLSLCAVLPLPRNRVKHRGLGDHDRFLPLGDVAACSTWKRVIKAIGKLQRPAADGGLRH